MTTSVPGVKILDILNEGLNRTDDSLKTFKEDKKTYLVVNGELFLVLDEVYEESCYLDENSNDTKTDIKSSLESACTSKIENDLTFQKLGESKIIVKNINLQLEKKNLECPAAPVIACNSCSECETQSVQPKREFESFESILNSLVWEESIDNKSELKTSNSSQPTSEITQTFFNHCDSIDIKAASRDYDYDQSELVQQLIAEYRHSESLISLAQRNRVEGSQVSKVNTKCKAFQKPNMYLKSTLNNNNLLPTTNKMLLLETHVKTQDNNAKIAYKTTNNNPGESNINSSQNCIALEKLVKSCEMKELKIVLERINYSTPLSGNLCIAESHIAKKRIDKKTRPEINLPKKSKKETCALNYIKNVPVMNIRKNSKKIKSNSCNAERTLRIFLPNIRKFSDIYKTMVENQLKIINIPSSLYNNFKKECHMVSKNSDFNNIYARHNKGTTSFIQKKRKSSLQGKHRGKLVNNSIQSRKEIINGLHDISIDDSAKLCQFLTENDKSKKSVLKEYNEEILDCSVNGKKVKTPLKISSSLFGISSKQSKRNHRKKSSGKKKKTTSMKKTSGWSVNFAYGVVNSSIAVAE